MSELGARIRERRLSLNWTQKELARRAGLSHTQISHLETGFSKPSAQSAMRIARALDIPVGELLGEPVPFGEALGGDVRAYQRLITLRIRAAKTELDQIKRKLSRSLPESSEELIAFIVALVDVYERRLEEAREKWDTTHPGHLADEDRDARDDLFENTFDGEFSAVIRDAYDTFASLSAQDQERVVHMQQYLEKRSA